MKCIDCQTEVLPGFSECLTCGATLPAIMRNANSPRHDTIRQGSPRSHADAQNQRFDFASAAAALSSPESEFTRRPERQQRASPDRAADADYYNIMYRKQREAKSQVLSDKVTSSVAATSRRSIPDREDRAAHGDSVWEPDDELYPWRSVRGKYLADRRDPPAVGREQQPFSTSALASSLSLQNISPGDALDLMRRTQKMHDRREYEKSGEFIPSKSRALSPTRKGAAANETEQIYQAKRLARVEQQQQQQHLSRTNVNSTNESSVRVASSSSFSSPVPAGAEATISPAAASAAAMRIEQQRQMSALGNTPPVRAFTWRDNKDPPSGSSVPTAAAGVAAANGSPSAPAAPSNEAAAATAAAQQMLLPFAAHAAAFMLELHTQNLYDAVAEHRADLLRLLRTALRERLAFERATEEIRQAETFAAKAGAIRTAESSKVMQENADLRFQLEEAHAAIERQKQITEQVASELAEVRAAAETTRLAYQSLGSPVQGSMRSSMAVTPPQEYNTGVF